MRITIFSDSHKDVKTMLRLTAETRPDAIAHLGDHIGDARELEKEFPDIPLYSVPGNTDTLTNSDTVKFADFAGKRALLTHGHTFDVSERTDGIRGLYKYGAEQGADIIMFGHTHEPFINCRDGIWIINPGRTGCISIFPVHSSYAVLEIVDGKVSVEIIDL